MTTVGDVFDVIDSAAPFSLAVKDDNSGLLVGKRANEITKVLACLDITVDVANEAIQKGVQLVISHHPVIYNPLYSLGEHPAAMLSRHNIAAICAHTNLDMANGGISDIMVEMLGAKMISGSMENVHRLPYYQLAVFVPTAKIEQVYDAMCDAGAGTLGNYSGCAFYAQGIGTFKPLNGSHAFIGEIGKREEVDEARLEMIVPRMKRREIIQAMLDAHPYEKPAYHLSENHAIIEEIGFGRICEFDREYTAKSLAEHIKKTFGNTVVRYNDTDKPIKKIGLCSGGSGGLIKKAISLGLDGYITGDCKHDQFIDAQNSGVALFDAGHFHTENVVLDYIRRIIKKQFPQLSVEIAQANHDPVSYEI